MSFFFVYFVANFKIKMPFYIFISASKENRSKNRDLDKEILSNVERKKAILYHLMQHSNILDNKDDKAFEF